MKRYKIKCIICGNEFLTNKKESKRCSRKCIAIGMTKYTNIKCLNCNNLYKQYNKMNKYCSRKCYSEAKSKICIERGYAVKWTKKMRDYQSKKYKGEGNPMYGKVSKMLGKERPEFTQEKHPNWRGGKFNTRGYIYINNISRRYGREKLEHRLIMEQHLGRKLLSSEIVHHINHNKLDNRIENLQIVSRAEHMKIHKEDIMKGRNSLSTTS